MRVRDLGSKKIHPLHFWVAVTLTTVFLITAFGILFIQTGHVPETPRWANAALLAYAWGVFVWAVMRQGHAVLPLQRVTFLVGVTLYFGSDLAPSLEQASWIKEVGCLLIIGSILSHWVAFGKRRPPSSDDAPTDQAEDIRGTV